MIMDPLRINIRVVAAAKFWEHLWGWEVSQTSLVYPGPVHNWNRRSLVRNKRSRGWREQILDVLEDSLELRVDFIHQPPHPSPPQLFH